MGRTDRRFDDTAAIEQLFSLLRVDSTWGKEKALALQLAEQLEQRGFEDVRLIEPLTGRPSVIGRIRGTGGGKTIILNGHLDTYEISNDWTRDPFTPEIAGGRIYGAGIADEKAGTAGLLAAACEFLRPERRPAGDIIFMGVSAHFEGGLGTRAVLDSGITADGAITCEPSNLTINNSHRGAAYIDVVTYGKQAHTTAKAQGYNAIEAMVPVIQAIGHLELPHEPDALGGPIINVGTIAGGTKHNQVPDRCQISIDVRLPAGLAPETVLGKFRDLLKHLAEDLPQFRGDAMFSPYWLSGPRNPSQTAPEHPLAMTVASAARSAGFGGEVTLPVWSDMCVLNERGIPSVNIGPGGPPYNWADEYVELEEYLTAVGIYVATIEAFCGMPS